MSNGGLVVRARRKRCVPWGGGWKSSGPPGRVACPAFCERAQAPLYSAQREAAAQRPNRATAKLRGGVSASLAQPTGRARLVVPVAAEWQSRCSRMRRVAKMELSRPGWVPSRDAKQLNQTR